MGRALLHEPIEIDRFRHGGVARVVDVERVARVKLGTDTGGLGRVLDGSVEVNDFVVRATRANPGVDLLAYRFTFGRVVVGAFVRRDRSADNGDVTLVRALDNLIQGSDQFGRGANLARVEHPHPDVIDPHVDDQVLPPGAGGEIAEGLVQGTLLGAYRFDRYKRAGGDDDAGGGIERLIVSAAADVEGSVSRAVIVATAQNRARDLGNRPPNDLTPTALGVYAAELAAERPALTASVLGGAELRQLGMGLFAGVASGSDEDPRLITLSYQGGPAGADSRRLALIGKAVTFDSGGLAIKSLAGMIDMKFDMAGGAAVIETMAALADLEAPINVLAVIGATENMISGTAMRAGDILTALDGTTVEMNNADAEGRLVLGDCITFARREGCDAIVDIATLTGGVVVALGSVYAGLMSNDDALAGLVTACGERTGELRLAPAAACRVRRHGQGPLRPDHQPHRAPRGLGHHRRGVPAPLRRRGALGAPGHRGRGRQRPGALPGQGRHRIRRAPAHRAGAELLVPV